ncbi:mannitol dehydrogenase family protein [Burkholderia sp. Ac-20344]|uniref:mannitol dehydrogenase family protein n=1 Tax=Burkholderia sp. Ac-20344 TaxID=2703890 RepID=UPI00197B5BE5|nr:mannitol dehydrogenase family protein [Burkholderia sp. Ac-20344]MBN3831897.1 mannitol dehydrogenase family protein [Burkholderia sp. Ac-20344]
MNHNESAPDRMDGMRHPLSHATLDRVAASIPTPAYDHRLLTAGIAHIGVGNFHRTHQARYIDRLLHLPGHHDWAICGIGLGNSRSSAAKADALCAQDCLYTLTEFSSNGAASARVIGAIIEYLHAPSDPEAVLSKLADPAIRIVSLTITEGGYNLDETTGAFRLDTPDVAHDLLGGPPRTAFGFIVEALRRRRAANASPFTVMSCDNLRANGDTARRAILDFARAVDVDLAVWIERYVAFPNSMVDRIAPQVTDQVRMHANRLSGIGDRVPVVAETFSQWVIEDSFSAGRPAFDAVGVELCEDVGAYEAMKGRMLNAAHMLLAYPAILLGHRFVHDAMADRDLAALLDAFLMRDVGPILTLPSDISAGDYAASILERFGNPALGDQLLRVGCDGASKIPVFHEKTIGTLIRLDRDIRREALLLACYQHYLSGVDDLGSRFAVDEPQLDQSDFERVGGGDPLAILDAKPFAALRLRESARFTELFRTMQVAIAQRSTRDAVRLALESDE